MQQWCLEESADFILNGLGGMLTHWYKFNKGLLQENTYQHLHTDYQKWDGLPYEFVIVEFFN